MKKSIVVPALCFAVLSTPAFAKAVHASGSETTSIGAKAATKYVNVEKGSSLLLRSNASMTGTILARLTRGTSVIVYSTTSGWSKVNVNGKTGYVSSEYLSSTILSSSIAKTTTKYVNVDMDSSLILRQSASTSSTILASLKRGTNVQVVSTSGDWSKVTVSGKTGYVHTEYLSSTTIPTSNSTTPVKTTIKYVNVDTDSSLILRQSASTSSTILASLKRGTSVQVVSTSGDWSKVTVNGNTGYVHTEYLSSANVSTSSISTTIKTTTKYVNVDMDSSLILRQSASTSSTILASLKRGTSVQVVSTSGDWSKVMVNGKTGYVHTEYLSSTTIPTSNSTTPVKTTIKYVNVDTDSSLILRQSASTSSTILASLKRGTSVQVVSTSGDWSKVTVNGKTGYVHTEYLSSTNASTSNTSTPEKTTTKYVNVYSDSTLVLRNRASTDSAILSSLKRGTSVQVLSTSGDWSKVTVNGLTGYVHTEYLSSTEVPTSSSTTPVKMTTKYVNVDSDSTLVLRNRASTDSAILSSLKRGTSVQVLSTSGDWSKVTVNGLTGYVYSQYLSSTNLTTTNVTDGSEASSGSETIQKYVYVSIGSTLNMRTSPSTSASIITQLTNGTVVQVISEADGWAKVSGNGKTGYVSNQYLSTSSHNSSTQSNSDSYQSYTITLDNMKNLELKVNPQTDKKYTTFIRSDALVVDDVSKPTKGVVIGSDWNVRGGAGTNYWVVGQVTNGSVLQIMSSIKGSDGYTWYQVSYNNTWVNASPDDVLYYLDPSNFINDPVQLFQFLKLSETAKINKDEVNTRILAGKGILAGKADSFITAGNTFGINELYLIAHALLETGNGTSELANGVIYNGKTVYNMYGIGAYDESPIESGAEYAYNAGWFTPEAAIIGGAQFIDNNYIEQGQDTLYKMRWNPEGAASSNSATHQYASDIGWAYKQVAQIYNLYHLLSSYQIELEIPEYLK